MEIPVLCTALVQTRGVKKHGTKIESLRHRSTSNGLSRLLDALPTVNSVASPQLDYIAHTLLTDRHQKQRQYSEINRIEVWDVRKRQVG